jgi:hypothetical protein
MCGARLTPNFVPASDQEVTMSYITYAANEARLEELRASAARDRLAWRHSPTGRRPRTGRWLAIALVTASLAAPAAAFGYPVDPPGGTGGSTIIGGSTNDADPGAPVPVTSAEDGFSWGDAGIGAGAAVGLVALTGAGLAVRRHTRTTPQPVA